MWPSFIKQSVYIRLADWPLKTDFNTESANRQAHTSLGKVPSIWAREATSVACRWIQAHHFHYAIDIVIVIKIRDTISNYAYSIQHPLGAFSGASKVPTHNLVHIKITCFKIEHKAAYIQSVSYSRRTSWYQCRVPSASVQFKHIKDGLLSRV